MEKKIITSESEIPTTGTVLVKFGAAWCGPCKMLDTVLEKFAEKREDVTVLFVDIDDESSVAFAKSKNVRSIPLTLVYKDGAQADSFNGAQSLQTLLSKI
jgi:thioredoxin 1